MTIPTAMQWTQWAGVLFLFIGVYYNYKTRKVYEELNEAVAKRYKFYLEARTKYEAMIDALERAYPEFYKDDRSEGNHDSESQRNAGNQP